MQDVLRAWNAPPGEFDELQDAGGTLRPHWAAFAGTATPPPDFDAAARRVARQLHDNGVTYNLQTAGSRARAWALDVLPHIVPADEWTFLADGLRQRARLLEVIAADLYGPQHLLHGGAVPPALVFSQPGFLRAAHGVTPPGGTWLHLLAFDLGRGRDGRWRVLSARTQAASGAGYALENRLVISRIFPDAFRDQRVERLAAWFQALQDTLLAQAPSDGTPPHVVLLTPGRYNETYFEHAYLARYLGFSLVEGADLTVRDDCVYLKTVGGLRRVHALLRRVDDDFCDPLELRSESALGVPGLVQAWRAGNVLVANAFGSGALESPALTPFLPAACRALFGEDLRVPSLGSWWCGDPAAWAHASDRLPDLVLRSSVAPAADPVFLGLIDQPTRAAWLDRLRDRPEQYLLEEYVRLTHGPVWADGVFESRALMMRVFVAADGRGDYRVLPGGLTRIGGTDHEIVSGQRGGSSKDTWVLSNAPIARITLLPGRLRARDLTRSERAVSSRSVEHLFWMGRYAERSENGARMLRAVLTRLPPEDPVVAPTSPPIAGACRQFELLPADLDVTTASAHEIERALIAGITSTDAAHGLAFSVAQTLRSAGAVRDRLSSDNWRILNGLAEMLARPGATTGLGDALDLLDHAIVSLVAAGGLEMAHMTRDEGWRFMSLGRHLERVLSVVTTTRQVAESGMEESGALLEWLLDLSDSLITYRARYAGQAQWIAVADLLLFDDRNPRSAAFQLAKLAKHVALLPGEQHDVAREVDVFAPAKGTLPDPAAIAAFLARAEEIALQLSDTLTLRYFSHIYEPAHATLL